MAADLVLQKAPNLYRFLVDGEPTDPQEYGNNLLFSAGGVEYLATCEGPNVTDEAGLYELHPLEFDEDEDQHEDGEFEVLDGDDADADDSDDEADAEADAEAEDESEDEDEEATDADDATDDETEETE